MPVVIQNSLANFARGTTKEFSILCEKGDPGVAQNITSDSVTLYLLENIDDDLDDAIFTKAGNCATQGASGLALFELTPTNTTIPRGTYYAKAIWDVSDAGTELHQVINQTIKCE